MDVKTILAISALVIGVVLIFKDQVIAAFQGIRQPPAPPATQPVQPVQVGKSQNQPVLTAQTNNLDFLILSLDAKKDKDEIDYLIDKLGPKLMRRRLTNEV